MVSPRHAGERMASAAHACSGAYAGLNAVRVARWCRVRDIGRLALSVLFSIPFSLMVLSLAHAAEPGELPPAVSLQVLPTVAPAGSQYPALHNAGERTFLSWLQTEADGHGLWFSVWQRGRWAAPQRIAGGRDWFVNWADFPALTVLTDGTLAAFWLRKSAPDSYAYYIELSFSSDGGLHWSPARSPHDDQTTTEHGFVSLLPQPDNTLSLFWLDGRDSLAHHERMQLRYANFDARGNKRREQLLDADTCSCCQTSAVASGPGDNWLVYRDHGANEVRDIAFVRQRNGRWTDPARVHADGWEIPGCPVNGPAIAQAGGQVGVLWYTGAQQQPRVQFAFAQGEQFMPPVRLDLGDPSGRVALLMPTADTAIAAWIERRGERAYWLARRVSRAPTSTAAPASAAAPVVLTELALARSSGFPRLALHGPDVMLAWTEVTDGQPPQVRTALIPLQTLP